MAHKLTYFSDANVAWKHWNETEFELRERCLALLAHEIAATDPLLGAVIQYHLDRAKLFLLDCHTLTGPTGETNELYASGRGVAVIIQKQEDSSGSVAVIAQLSAALIAGNSIVLCSDDVVLIEILESAISKVALPEKLIQLLSVEQCPDILSSDIRSVGLVGSVEDEAQINHVLAGRSGAIISFISETDLIKLPTSHDPYLSLRFITERTRTINITAIGGNASLLEMGNSPH